MAMRALAQAARAYKRVVIHHHLVEDGRIESRFLQEGPLSLDPPGLTIEVQDTFVGL